MSGGRGNKNNSGGMGAHGRPSDDPADKFLFMLRQPGHDEDASIHDLVANWKTYDSTKSVRKERAGELVKN